MKQKILLPIFFFMILSLSIFVSALKNCSDSDDGANYFLKGLIIPRASDEQVWDSCKNNKVLYEGTCDEQGGKVYEYECPGACEDGACVCSDSDNGKDYFTKGLVIARAGDEQVWDSCKTDYILYEGTCDEQGGAFYEYQCPEGCLDGACKEDASNTCSDSDNGKNYFSKGIVVTSDETFTDTCEGKILTEGTCDEQGGKVYEYECPGACEDGACVCSDSDNGKDYFTKGLVIARAGDEQVWDSCKTDYILYEGTCDEQGGAVYEYQCLNGCSEGKCLKFEPSEETGPIDLPEDISKEEVVALCNGCEKDVKCYPFNYRKDKEYCSIDKEFVPQLKPESSCENNFECDSNLCINDECVSGNLWSKFIRWLSKFFG